jgi:hypothetical protein
MEFMAEEASQSGVRISTSLGLEPHKHYRSWMKEVREQASYLHASFYERGLLGRHVVTLSHVWVAQNPPQAVEGQEGLQPVPRPFPTKPTTPAGQPTNLTMNLYDKKMHEYLDFCRSSASLKRAIVSSLGSMVRMEVERPDDGFESMLIHTILDEVYARYGQVNETVITDALKALDLPFTSEQPIMAQVAKLTETFATLADAQQPKSDAEKMLCLERACSNILPATRAIEMYKTIVQPMFTKRTYADMCVHLRNTLPSIVSTSTAGYVSHATAITRVHELEQRLALLETLLPVSSPTANGATMLHPSPAPASSRTARHTGSRKRSKKDHAPHQASPFYCFVHGYNDTHPGSACRLMTKLSHCFSSQQRAATSPSDVPVQSKT